MQMIMLVIVECGWPKLLINTTRYLSSAAYAHTTDSPFVFFLQEIIQMALDFDFYNKLCSQF